MTDYPQLQTTVLDATDVRELAEFYRKLLGLQYQSGDEPPADGSTDDLEWLVLTDARGARQLARRAVPVLPRVTWPDASGVAQQLRLNLTVPDREALETQRRRAHDRPGGPGVLAAGARRVLSGALGALLGVSNVLGHRAIRHRGVLSVRGTGHSVLCPP